MVQLAVFLFVVSCLGYGSTLVNHPSKFVSWSPRILNPDPTLEPIPPLTIEMVEFVLKNMAENESTSELVFYVANLGTRMRSIIDMIFYSWDLYRKELALENEDGKTVVEVNRESEESDPPGMTPQSAIVGDGIQATTAKMESIYNEGIPFRTGRILKKFFRAKSATVRPSTHLADSTTASTSGTKYTFVTNLKIDRGTAGVDYPDYADIPETAFSCSDKIIPGFYADLETGCQVFHACWPDRKESLLCPVGTTFNQTLMKCDYWYNTNCSMAPLFFDLNIHFLKETAMNTGNLSTSQTEYSSTSAATEPYETANNSAETKHPEKELSTEDWNRITDFLPMKAKITVYSNTSKHDRKPTSDVPLHSALKSKQLLSEQDKVRKVQVASRIVDGAFSLAERVAKETAKMVMDIIKHRTKSEEKAQKVEAAAKIVDEATDLAAKVAKDTAHLVSKITLEVMSRNSEKSTDHVIPSKNLNPHDVKERFTTPKTTQQEPLTVNPRFVVKPLEETVTFKQIQQLNSYDRNDAKDHVLEVIDRAFEIVLTVDVFPATRRAILENYVKFALSKKH